MLDLGFSELTRRGHSLTAKLLTLSRLTDDGWLCLLDLGLELQEIRGDKSLVPIATVTQKLTEAEYVRHQRQVRVLLKHKLDELGDACEQVVHMAGKLLLLKTVLIRLIDLRGDKSRDFSVTDD